MKCDVNIARDNDRDLKFMKNFFFDILFFFSSWGVFGLVKKDFMYENIQKIFLFPADKEYELSVKEKFFSSKKGEKYKNSCENWFGFMWKSKKLFKINKNEK